MEGRSYTKWMSKRRAPYWEDFLEYLDEDQHLRVEYKFFPNTFNADSNVNGTKNLKNHAIVCLDEEQMLMVLKVCC